MLEDSSARTALRKVVEDAGGDPEWVADRPRSAVLVMGNSKLINAETLFSFSRMRLVRLADEYRMYNIDLAVMPIAYAV